MILLDLFCGAGGASKGYVEAGFKVVGVDINPQPNYPFEFIQYDALSFLGAHGYTGIDAIHASPPCQAFTAYHRSGNVKKNHPNLIPQTRWQLIKTGLPYIIENVYGAPLNNPLKLCGSMFGLDVQRHRYFETNFEVFDGFCDHKVWQPNRFPGGRSKERTGDSRGLCRGTVEIGSWDISLEMQSKAMDIDWMNVKELSQAIPPSYTEYIGRHLITPIMID